MHTFRGHFCVFVFLALNFAARGEVVGFHESQHCVGILAYLVDNLFPSDDLIAEWGLRPDDETELREAENRIRRTAYLEMDAKVFEGDLKTLTNLISKIRGTAQPELFLASQNLNSSERRLTGTYLGKSRKLKLTMLVALHEVLSWHVDLMTDRYLFFKNLLVDIPLSKTFGDSIEDMRLLMPGYMEVTRLLKRLPTGEDFLEVLRRDFPPALTRAKELAARDRQPAISAILRRILRDQFVYMRFLQKLDIQETLAFRFAFLQLMKGVDELTPQLDSPASP